MIPCEQIDYLVDRTGEAIGYLHCQRQLSSPAPSYPFVNLVSASAKFVGPKLVASRVPVVISPDLLMAVEAEWDAVVLIVGATFGFSDDVGGFDVRAALLEAQTTNPVAADKHCRLYGRVKRHGATTVDDQRLAAIARIETAFNECIKQGYCGEARRSNVTTTGWSVREI